MTVIDQDTPETSLTARQETFITALLSAPSIIEATRIAGIGEKTGRRWLQLPHVQAAYQAAQREVFDSSLTTLKLAVHDAVSTLSKLMKDEETPATSRIRAAQIILEQSIELHKMSELEQKIAELEQLVKERNV